MEQPEEIHIVITLSLYLEDNVLVCLEQPERPDTSERVERRVKDVRRERGERAAEEYHPAELHTPEGRHLFHREQQSAHGGTERCSDSSGSARRREVPPVF